MNRDAPLIPTSIFLLFILNAIYLYTVKIEDIAYTPVQQIVADNKGTIWALFGSSLIDLSDKKSNRSFLQHGFENHVGQVIPLASGEWVLNVGAQGEYLKRAVVRTTQEESAEYQSSGSLLKCNAELTNCMSWGEAELQFERAFDGIELEGGHLLLFKAEQQRIFLVEKSGIVLSQIQGEELWFGVNQASDGNWFGLNTGSGGLTRINIAGNTITAEKMPFDFSLLEGDTDKIISPSKTLEYNGSYWTLGFVLNTNVESRLEEAERIIDMTPSLLNIEIETNKVKRLPYDFRADAEIELIGDNIYFADFDKHEIKRFDLASETMDLVKSQNLQTAFDLDSAQVKSAKKKLYTSLTVNGVAALLALIWLLVKSVPLKEKEDEVELSDDVIPYDSSNQKLDKELRHVARVFSKKKLSFIEAKAIAPFKKIDNVYVYYPKGMMGKGRVVPDGQTLVDLYKWGERSQLATKKWLLYPLLMVCLSVVLVGLSKYVGLLLLLCGLVALLSGLILMTVHQYKRNKIVRNLLIHDSRLTFSDAAERIAQALPHWGAWYFIATGVIVLLIQCYSLYEAANQLEAVVTLSMILFPFGGLLLFFGIKIRAVKQRLEAPS